MRARVSGASLNGVSGFSAGNDPKDLAKIAPAAGGDTPQPKAENRAFWLEAVGGWGSVDGDDQARGADYTTYGAAGGVEWETSDTRSKVGGVVAFSQTDSDMEGLSDESEVRAYQAGAYGMYRIDDYWHMNGSVSAAWLDFETSRSTTLGTAQADFDGVGVFGYVESLYDYTEVGGMIVSPYVGLDGSVIYHEDYSESGAGALNMDVDDQTHSQFSTVLGVQLQGEYDTENYVVAPTVKVGWAHQYLDQSTEQSASFSSAPSAVIETEGPEQNRGSARLKLGVSVLNPDEDIRFYVSYDGEIATDAEGHALTAGFKKAW